MIKTLDEIAINRIFIYANKYEGKMNDTIEWNIKRLINIYFTFLNEEEKEKLIPYARYCRRYIYTTSTASIKDGLLEHFNAIKEKMLEFFDSTNLVREIEGNFFHLKNCCPINNYLFCEGIHLYSTDTDTLLLEYEKYKDKFPNKELYDLVIQRWKIWSQITNR